MATEVEVRGLEELQKRFKAYPLAYQKVMAVATATGLLVLQEHVPPYPPKPVGSKYKRKGSAGLGGSIGSSEAGGRSGAPDIFKVRKLGIGHEGKMGTKLKYAPRVIGSKGQQSEFFAKYWWRLEDVPEKAMPKLLTVFKKAAAQLAAFLEGKKV